MAHSSERAGGDHRVRPGYRRYKYRFADHYGRRIANGIKINNLERNRCITKKSNAEAVW